MPAVEKTPDRVRTGFSPGSGVDTLVVGKLDCLVRSMPHLIETVQSLVGRGVGFRSLTEWISTTTSGGTLVFDVFGALAQFERAPIGERALTSLFSPRTRGRNVGSKPSATPAKIAKLANWQTTASPYGKQPRGSGSARRLSIRQWQWKRKGLI